CLSIFRKPSAAEASDYPRGRSTCVFFHPFSENYFVGVPGDTELLHGFSVHPNRVIVVRDQKRRTSAGQSLEVLRSWQCPTWKCRIVPALDFNPRQLRMLPCEGAHLPLNPVKRVSILDSQHIPIAAEQHVKMAVN